MVECKQTSYADWQRKEGKRGKKNTSDSNPIKLVNLAVEIRWKLGFYLLEKMDRRGKEKKKKGSD